MGSNVTTDYNQGGGSAKAGAPSTVGIDWWTAIAYRERGAYQSLAQWRTPQFRVPLISKEGMPAGIDSRIKMR